MVLGDGLGIGWIELRGLVEVVGGIPLGDLFGFPTGEAHVEFGLGRSSGGMDQRR